MVLCPSVLGDDAKTFAIRVVDKNSLNFPDAKVYLDGLNDENFVGITDSRGEMRVPVIFGKHTVFAISPCGSASKEYNFSDNIITATIYINSCAGEIGSTNATKDEISKNNSEIILDANIPEPLKLNDGYELAVKSVDIDGNKAYVELSKDGQAVAGKVIIPANKADGAFVYSKPGTSQLIMVHIKNAFRGADSNLVTIDGVLQTSETDPSLVLRNDSDMLTLVSGTNLKLNDGYELVIRSVDIDGNKVYLELTKEGQLVESRVIVAANGVDDAFVYPGIIGTKSIAAHFKNAFRGAEANLVTVDGISQG